MHTHKYLAAVIGENRVKIKNGKKVLIKRGGYPVFKCVLPGCTHYVGQELAVGRETICWLCGEILILNSRSAKMKKPHHRECGLRERKAA